MAAHTDPPSLSHVGASDMELVELTRSGDSSAFGELWVRHSGAGRAVARSSRFDADDLLSEGFARVFQAITSGGGPTTAFRPYLFTTIRNVSMQWARAKSADASEDLDLMADPSTEEDASLAALDRSLTANAFRSLPTRWQEALWYSEVEQLSAQDMSPLLGMKANAVSALTYRAREGLRQAWIQAHLKRTTDPECAATIERLGSFARGTLGAREARRVQDHLATCTSCAIVADEARAVGGRLALVLLPLAAGISGAAGFLAWTQTGGSGAGTATVAAFAMPAHVTAASGAGQIAAPVAVAVTASSAGGIAAGFGAAGVIGTTVGALAAAAALVAAVTLGPGLWNPAPEPSPQSTEAQDPAPLPSDPPAAASEPAPVSTEQPSTEGEPPVGAPQQEQPAADSPVTEPAGSAVATPQAPPVVVVPPATPPTTPPTTPPDVTPATTDPVPNATLVASDGDRVYPSFSGTGARSAARIDLVDEEGTAVMTTTVADDGSWSFAPDAFDGILREGSQTLAVRQSLDGVTSEQAFPTVMTMRVPTIVFPTSDYSFEFGFWALALLGQSDAQVEVSIDDNVDGVIDDVRRYRLESGVEVRARSGFDGPSRMTVRYIDESGDYGVPQTVRFTVTGMDRLPL